MKASDKKYPLSVLDDLRASTLNFMSDKIYFDGVEYIRKDALLEWAEEEMMKAAKQSDSYGRRNAFMDVIDKIESL